MEEVVFLLPKKTANNCKDTQARLFIKNQTKQWIDLYVETNYSVVFFAEDMLAVDLFHDDPNIQWVSILSKGDLNFMKHKVEDLPKEYFQLEVLPCDKKLLEKALKEYPTNRNMIALDEVENIWNRFHLLIKRMKYCMTDIVSNSKHVVFIDALSANQLKEPISTLGDGKTLVILDVKNAVAKCYYSGCILEDTLFHEVLKNRKHELKVEVD